VCAGMVALGGGRIKEEAWEGWVAEIPRDLFSARPNRTNTKTSFVAQCRSQAAR